MAFVGNQIISSKFSIKTRASSVFIKKKREKTRHFHIEIEETRKMDNFATMLSFYFN